MSLEPRVDTLEDNMKAMAQSMIKMSNEMRDFKDEMSDFKDEMSDFKDEMRDFKDEMRDFKDEMSDFKDEINIKWGNLSNQLGLIVENLIIPNIDILIDNYFEETILAAYPRVFRRSTKTNDGKEFDGVIVTQSHIFLFEIKNQVRLDYIDQFNSFVQSGDFFTFFPEYTEKKLVPVMGSLALKDHQIKELSKYNILALSIKGDILHFENIDSIDI